MKIALDAMGGDLAPKATVDGAVLAARDFGIEVVLIGDRALLEKELAGADAANLPITIAHAAEVVGMDESPLESVLSKPNSSMHVGYEMLKRGEVDGLVSAGNSGAMMAAAMVILGNLAGVDRPAIASLIPNSSDLTLLIDAGANVEVKPSNLVEFAIMGSVYSRRVRRIARPRIGILSNGEEDSKGNDITRTAAAILRGMAPHVNYIGYVEGRDINRGNVDVVVTDGFTGNVALKTMEGFGAFLLGNLREVFGASFRGRLAYLLVRKRLSAMRERLDPSEYGGAPLLGVNGVAIIAHGSSNARAIRNAIRAGANESLVRQVNTDIVELLKRIPATTAAPAKAGGKGIRALFAKVRGRLQRHPKEEAESPRSKPTPDAPHKDFRPSELAALAPHDSISVGTDGLHPPSTNGSSGGLSATHEHRPAENDASTSPEKSTGPLGPHDPPKH